jgi:hypothetical protein
MVFGGSARGSRFLERAIHNAKQIYIHDHIDNGLEDITRSTTREARTSLAEFKEITKYL